MHYMDKLHYVNAFIFIFFNGGHPIRYDVWLRLAAYFKKRSSILFLFFMDDASPL